MAEPRDPRVYELNSVNDWWWALRPDGGSIRLKNGGYWFYPNEAAVRKWLSERIRRVGPFRSLDLAFHEALLRKVDHASD